MAPAAKRKAQDTNDQEESNSKRSRLSDGAEKLQNKSPEKEKDSHNESRPGTLLKIHVKNFMCHDSLEVIFNPKINLIIGRNGSGKSAILAAIVVGLGGKAMTTDRARAITSFIKKGKTRASIEITLSNKGKFPYKPELYGSKIIVIRTLSLSSCTSTYKIKAVNGKTVTTLYADLRKILAAFNIQVDNPICILNQDTARTFLKANTPHDNYQLFMKATQLDLIESHCLRVRQDLRTAKEVLKEKMKCLTQVEEDLKASEMKWNIVKHFQSVELKKKELYNELSWAEVICEENKLMALNNQVSDSKKKRNNVDRRLAHAKATEQTLENRIKDTLEEVESTKTELETLECTLEEVKQDAKNRKQEYISKLMEHKEMQKAVTNQRKCIKGLQNEIDKINRDYGFDSSIRKQDIEKEQGELEQKRVSMVSKLKAIEDYRDLLRTNYQEFKENKRGLETELNYVDGKCKTLQGKLESVKSLLHIYGSWVPKYVGILKELHAKKQLKEIPKGPIGNFLKLHDASWALAIESILGELVTGFCVDNENDRKLCCQVLKNIGVPKEEYPTVIVSKFIQNVHDVSANSVQESGYYSVYDMLIIEDPVIANCLIDQLEIESILLISTRAKACQIMDDELYVPLNCKIAVTKEGEVFSPGDSYGQFYLLDKTNKAKYLQVSVPDTIKNLQNEIDNHRSQYHDTEQKLKKESENVDNNKEKLKEAEEQVSTLRRELNEIERTIQKLNTSSESVPSSVSSLKEEIVNCNKELDTSMKEEQKVGLQCKEIPNVVEQTKKKRKEIKKTIRNKESDQENLERTLHQLKYDLKVTHKRIEDETESQKEVNESINDLEQQLNDQQKVVVEKTAEAKKLCERIQTSRNPQSIKDEIFWIDKNSKELEVQAENKEMIESSLRDNQKKFKRIKILVNSLENIRAELKKILHKRSNVFLTMRTSLCVKVQYLFRRLLLLRNFQGDIEFNHKNETLTFNISSLIGIVRQNSNMSSLSGGERSYSTMAFIMSLWETMQLPFYMMDEFDVFMDKVNRRVTFDLLVNQARERLKFQFAFFTPLDSPGINADDRLTILKLKDPRESRPNTANEVSV